jgi:ribose-phosphate pyrophosphokinase
VPLAIIDKRRFGDDEKAHAVHVIGDVAGRKALVVDDEISTGGTVLEACDIVLANGAREVLAAVIHPVFSGPAVSRLRASPLTEVVVTDTIPLPPEKQDPKFKVLSVASLIAEAIARIHDGRSVSELFA